MNLFATSASHFINAFNSAVQIVGATAGPLKMSNLSYFQSCFLIFSFYFTGFFLGAMALIYTFNFLKNAKKYLAKFFGTFFKNKERAKVTTLALTTKISENEFDILGSDYFILEPDNSNPPNKNPETAIKNPGTSFFSKQHARHKIKKLKDDLRAAKSEIATLEAQRLNLQEEIEGINHLWEVTSAELKDLRAKHQSLLQRALIVSPKDKTGKFKNPSFSPEKNNAPQKIISPDVQFIEDTTLEDMDFLSLEENHQRPFE